MVVAYLVLIEIGKRRFYRTARAAPTIRRRMPRYRIHRRAARFTTATELKDSPPQAGRYGSTETSRR
jgi:Mg2+-importing ATPase